MKRMWDFVNWSCMTITLICSIWLAIAGKPDAKVAWACCAIWVVGTMNEKAKNSRK